MSQQLKSNQQAIIEYINQLKASDLSQLLEFSEAIEKMEADLISANESLKKRHIAAYEAHEQGFDLKKTKEYIHLNCLEDEKGKLYTLFYQQYTTLFMKQMLTDQSFAEACASLYQPQLDQDLHRINIQECEEYGLPTEGTPEEIELVRDELTRRLKAACQYEFTSLQKIQSLINKGARVLGNEQNGVITETTPLIEAIDYLKGLKDKYSRYNFDTGRRCIEDETRKYFEIIQYLANLSRSQLNNFTTDGKNPLKSAILSGNAACIELLLTLHANTGICYKNEGSLSTLALREFLHGRLKINEELFIKLIENCSPQDMNTKDNSGCTAIYHACRYSNRALA